MCRTICILLAATLLLSCCASKPAPQTRCSSSITAAQRTVPAARESHPSTPTAQLTASARPSPVRGDSAHGGKADQSGISGATSRDHLPNSPLQMPVHVVLPSVLYLVVGETYRLQYNEFIDGYRDGMHVEIRPLKLNSATTADHWEYTPESAGAFTLSLTIIDSTGNTLSATSRRVKVLEVPESNAIRHLSIGDSITRAGAYAEYAVLCVARGRLVGTRTYDNGAVSHEGRGGWTMHRYMTRLGEAEGGDSPFLFPAEVDGEKYLGNTMFWRKVTSLEPEGYDYAGFQRVARGWRAEGEFDYDRLGYPTQPSVGDVIVDPSLGAEREWRMYDGTAWTPMSPQPRSEFSFSKYIDRYSNVYEQDGPTSISIMLGTVDFLAGMNDDSWASYKHELDQLIDSIRSWDTIIPIILIGAPSGGPAEMWVDLDVTGSEFNHRMIEHSRRLYDAYDTSERKLENIYVISFLGTVSPTNMADYVHPKVPDGHYQMGPWLAGALAQALTAYPARAQGGR